MEAFADVSRKGTWSSSGFLPRFVYRYGAAGRVALVAQDELAAVLGGVLVYLGEPLGDVVEGLAVRDVVDHHHTICAAVVRARIPCRYESDGN